MDSKEMIVAGMMSGVETILDILLRIASNHNETLVSDGIESDIE